MSDLHARVLAALDSGNVRFTPCNPPQIELIGIPHAEGGQHRLGAHVLDLFMDTQGEYYLRAVDVLNNHVHWMQVHIRGEL